MASVYRQKSLTKNGEDLGTEYILDLLERFELSQEEQDWIGFEEKWSEEDEVQDLNDDTELSTKEIIESCKAKDILKMVKDHFGIELTTDLKNKKKIVKQAGDLFEETAQTEKV